MKKISQKEMELVSQLKLALVKAAGAYTDGIASLAEETSNPRSLIRMVDVTQRLEGLMVRKELFASALDSLIRYVDILSDVDVAPEVLEEMVVNYTKRSLGPIHGVMARATSMMERVQQWLDANFVLEAVGSTEQAGAKTGATDALVNGANGRSGNG